jgi:hypothetical protein
MYFTSAQSDWAAGVSRLGVSSPENQDLPAKAGPVPAWWLGNSYDTIVSMKFTPHVSNTRIIDLHDTPLGSEPAGLGVICSAPLRGNISLLSLLPEILRMMCSFILVCRFIILLTANGPFWRWYNFFCRSTLIPKPWSSLFSSYPTYAAQRDVWEITLLQTQSIWILWLTCYVGDFGPDSIQISKPPYERLSFDLTR